MYKELYNEGNKLNLSESLGKIKQNLAKHPEHLHKVLFKTKSDKAHKHLVLLLGQLTADKAFTLINSAWREYNGKCISELNKKHDKKINELNKRIELLETTLEIKTNLQFKTLEVNYE